VENPPLALSDVCSNCVCNFRCCHGA
jgi:hypothetical protein